MSNQTSDNNKRIAKNTLFLYFRMAIMMAVSLFTSRILLQKLGVEDYGTYNIVGGIIVMFSFIQAPISSATQRFINFALGKDKLEDVQKTFSVSLFLYLLFCVIVVILGETIGLWFLNFHMNFPEGRMFAVNVIYQITILTFCLGLVRTPYYASVIAYERMDFFAYWSIFMAFLKLLIVYVIVVCPWDRLITYVSLFACVTLIEFFSLVLFCNMNFKTTKFVVSRDRQLLKEMTSFSGWSMFGGVANTASQYGLNILINIFFGVTLNAAIGIANQVSTNLYQLISNFQTAFNPQIVRLYAQGKRGEFLLLIERASKFSYYLFLVVSVPFIVFINPILEFWLVTPPPYTGNFCRLILIFNLMMAASNPMWMSVQATGNIKKYQILMSSLLILNFPLAYVFLKLGTFAYTIWIIRILVEVVVYVVRLYYLRGVIGIDANRFLCKITGMMTLLLVLNVAVTYWIKQIYDGSLISLLALMLLSAVITSVSSFLLGFSRDEQRKIVRFVLKK